MSYLCNGSAPQIHLLIRVSTMLKHIALLRGFFGALRWSWLGCQRQEWETRVYHIDALSRIQMSTRQ